MIAWFLIACTSGLGGGALSCTSAQPVADKATCEVIADQYSIAVAGSGRLTYRCFSAKIDVEKLPVDPN